jgi:polyhydroxyalkanoate synthase
MPSLESQGFAERSAEPESFAGQENKRYKRGYLDAQDMATSFNMLRANDLIWSFAVR